MILINLFVLTLPLIFGNAGIWISYPLAELVTLVFVVIFFRNSWRDDLNGLGRKSERLRTPGVRFRETAEGKKV
jgi:hypothetical protein